MLGMALAVILLGLFLPGRPRNSRASLSAPVPVSVEVVRSIAKMADTFDLDGDVEPHHAVAVSAEVAGRIERYGKYTGANGQPRQLREGDRVLKGAPLVYLNKDLIQAEHDRDEASYTFDLADKGRVQRAFDRNVATKTELESAKTKVAVSKARLDLAKARLKRTTIYAPISGIVNELPMDVGEYAQEGHRCAEIVDDTKVKVVVHVPERDIGYMKLGGEAEISGRPGETLQLTGTISYISRLADPAARTTRVEILVENPDGALHSRKVLTVRLKRRDLSNVIMIPLAAAIPGERLHTVYVVDNGKAQPRTVALDTRMIKERRILIDPRDGLKAGDLLIVEGQYRCGPGQPVRIVEGAPKPSTVPAGRPGGSAIVGAEN